MQPTGSSTGVARFVLFNLADWILRCTGLDHGATTVTKHILCTLFSGLILAASAQAGQKARIDFPFRTPAGELPAGKYLVETKDMASSKYIQLTNLETSRSVLFYPETQFRETRGGESPRMVFSCTSTGCNLSQIWTESVNGFGIRQKKLSPAEAERLTVVRMGTEATE